MLACVSGLINMNWRADHGCGSCCNVAAVTTSAVGTKLGTNCGGSTGAGAAVLLMLTGGPLPGTKAPRNIQTNAPALRRMMHPPRAFQRAGVMISLAGGGGTASLMPGMCGISA